MTLAALIVLLVLAFVAGLLLVPFGLPGLWVMVLAIIGFGALTEFRTVGVVTMGMVVGIAFMAEVMEAWVGFRYASQYGGSRRAGWGALLGGMVGALVGLPIPIVGSVVGSFLGSFAGAALLEYTRSPRAREALSAGWGALLGRTWAVALKVALGLMIATIGLVAALRA
jgi:uncharacterized protein YqgC (DUF456 family)